MRKIFTITIALFVFSIAFGFTENAGNETAPMTDEKNNSRTGGDVLLTSPSEGFDNSFIGPLPPPCPLIAEPVCGSNGASYLNACYAQLAGVTQYTYGVCFSSCINPSAMNPGQLCPQVYDPVCGCNGKTYGNSCEAQRAGVTSTTPGPCNTSCFNPSLVLNGGGVSLDVNTGVLTLICAQTNAPVCGCNGISYVNACVAQANGISFYTAGSCQSACINPALMNPNANCPGTLAPVCGCNSITYPNACSAAAAGVTSTTQGPCGGLSAWCNKAVLIQCGDYLPFETTVGAGNSINAYPGCSNSNFAGPDKVYMIHKTTPGDLQIGLEIMTPGLDLDLFLLFGNCSQVQCLRSSTTNNSITNNEGILLVNAPIGTYYIVVDGQFANSQGQYRLEVSCGYLNCQDAIPLTCGVPFNHTNLNGHDDVSLYGCDGNIYNVENNGPEVVHTFTVTAPGWVNVSLTNLQANLELFLLRSCDRGGCMYFSETGGTANEQITAFLQPGTYYVVVDGYNGAVSPYTLLVDCASGCTLKFASIAPTAAGCGQSNGSITTTTTGGAPGYTVQYSGPVSGTISSPSATNTISNLPAGLYEIRVTDTNGCTIMQSVTVPSNSNMAVGVQLTAAICGTGGTAQFTMTNGVQPYTVQLFGPVSGFYNAGSANPYTISGLADGNYTAYIRDALGCVVVKTFTISYSAGSFSFTGTPTTATCNAPGSILISVSNGTAPYVISVNGLQTVVLLSLTNQTTIPNLPGGVYTVTVTANDGCHYTQVITVPDTSLRMTASAQNGACNLPGSISIQLSGGVPPYNIIWNGPTSGSVFTSAGSYQITGLTSGNYAIQVQDALNCVRYEVLNVNNSGSTLSATFSALGSCAATGSINIQLNNGTPTYAVTWSGPVSGNATTSQANYTIPNLPGGAYVVNVTDSGGCTRTGMVTLVTGIPPTLTLTANNSGCGQTGSISVAIGGAGGPYGVSWTGPVSGSATSPGANYLISNLPSGIYTVTVSSGGCQVTKLVAVANGNLNIFSVQLMPIHQTCTTAGAIWLDMYGGNGPFTIVWAGPTFGSTVTNQNGIDIPVGPGTYIVVVTNSAGCSASGTVTILNNSLQLTATTPGGNCVGTTGNIALTIANGQPNYQIVWTGPVSGSAVSASNNYQITGVPAGAYTITVIDAAGCTSNITVHLNNQFSIYTEITHVSCVAPGQIKVGMAGGVGPYTVSWTGPSSGSATTNDTIYLIPNLGPGSYSITVLSANGCIQTTQVSLLSSGGGLNLTLTPVPGLCGPGGSIWLDITGGPGPYQLSWTGPVSGSIVLSVNGYNIPNLPSGTYTVTVTNASGCSATQTVTLINTGGNVIVSLTPVPGNCGQPGSIGVHIQGGQGPYHIVWSGPISGSANTPNSAYVINNLPSGTYTVTVTGSDGCSGSSTTVVTNSGGGILLTGSAEPGDCISGGAIWLDIMGGSPFFTITWTGPVSGSTTFSNFGYLITNLPNGTYTVQVTDFYGCISNPLVITVFSGQMPTFTATPYPGLCNQPGSIAVHISSSTGPHMVFWTGPVSGMANSVGNAYVINNLPSGTYTVTVKGANDCTKTQTVTLNNTAGNVNLVITPVPGVCASHGSLWVDIVGGTPPYVLSWTGPVSGSITLQINGYNIPNLPSGTYTVTVTDANGCTKTVTVTLNNGPNNLQITAVPVPGVCAQPGQIHVGITGGTAPFTVSWTGPVNGSANTNNFFYNILNLPSGTYVITVVDANGCVRTITRVLNNGVGNIHLVVTPVPGVCAANGSLWVDIVGGTPPYLLTWVGPVSGSINLQINGYNIPNLPSGTYTVKVTDANGCMFSVVTTLINGANNLQITAVPVPGLCGQTGQIHVGMTGGTAPFTVSWSGPVSGSATTNNFFYNILNLPSGTYVITVVDANGCIRTHTVVLNNSGASIVLTGSAEPGDCGMNGAIWLDITGGSPFFVISWTGPVSGSITFSNFGYLITNLPNGTYTVQVTDFFGCVSNHLVVTVNSGAMPTFTATPHPGLCGQNGSISLNIGGSPAPYMVFWTGPVSGMAAGVGSNYTIPNLPSGTYSITVKDANDCTKTHTVILHNGANNLQITAVPVPGVCAQPGQIHVGMTGGTAPFTVSWTGPVNGSANTNNFFYNILNLPSGTYVITVVDANGCSRSQTVILNNGANNVNLVVTPVPGVCAANGSLWVDILGGTPPYVLSWTGPVSGSINLQINGYSIPNLPSGTYTVTVVDANGCVRTVTVTLNNGANNLIITAVPVPGVCAQPGQIHVGMSGGTAPFAVTWSGPVNGSANTNNFFYNIQNLPSGTYIIIVTDANGCTRSQTVILNNGANTLQITAVGVPGVCAQPGQIHVGITGGTAPFTVTWSGPVSGSANTNNFFYNIQNLPSGTYVITVVDANGCSRSQTLILNNGANNLQITAVPVPGVCAQLGQIHVGMTGGTAPFTVTWAGPVNGSATTSNFFYNILSLPSGTYTVAVTDANGCVRTITVTLNNGANTLQITAVPVPGVCAQPGQIHVGMTGGTAPYSVMWMGPQNGMTTTGNAFYNILNLPSGIYTITVTDANGCVRTQTVTLNNGSPITLAATAVNGICGQLGSIQLVIGGPTPPYTVTWTGPVSGNATANTGSYTLPNLPSGTYVVTVSSGVNCSASQTVTLNNGATFNMAASANNGICDQNGSISLSFTGGVVPIAIVWTGPVNGSASTNANNYTLSNLPGGTYTITATTAQNCTDTEIITLNNATNTLMVTATPVNGLCSEPGSVILVMTGGPAPYNIVWTGAASGSATSPTATYTVNNLGAGTYTFTVTAANGCVASTTATVAVAENDIAITTTSTTGDCGQEGSIQLIISGGNPGYTINWSGPESGSIQTSNPIVNLDALLPGTYDIIVTDATGCAEASTVTLSTPEADLNIGLSAVNGICGQNGAVVVTFISGNPPYSVNWTGPISGNTTTSNSSFTIANAPAGMYFVTVTDDNDCTDSGTIVVNSTGGVSATAVAMSGVCGMQGSVIVNLVGGTAPYVLNWSGAASGTITIVTTTHTIPNLGSGTYNIMVTDANGCVSSASATVNNTGVPFSINAFSYNGFCGELGLIRVNMFGGVGPFMVSWIGPVSGSAVTTTSPYEIPNLPSGMYIVTVTDAQGCTGSDVELINNYADDVLNVTTTVYNGTCGNLGIIWITINQGQAPYIVTWTGPVSGSMTTNQNSFDIPDLPSGTYTVTVRDFSLCLKTFTLVVNNAPDNLNINLVGNLGVCGNPGSITVNINGNAPPYVITWSSVVGSGNQTITGNTFTIPNLVSGSYNIRVDDAAGCFETGFVQLNNQSGALNLNIVPNVGACGFQSSIQVNVSGGQGPFLLTWSGPANGSFTFTGSSHTIFGIPPGTYMILVTGAGGCSAWQTVVLNTGNAIPVASFTHSLNQFTASFTNNSSTGSYLWSFGDGSVSTAENPIHTYAQHGNYTVCLTVSNPCGSAQHCSTVAVTLPPGTVILDIGESSGAAGSTILVPVRIQNCSLLVSLAGSLSVALPSVANIVGVQPAAISPQFNTVNKTFNYYANNGTGVTLQQDQILFYLAVQLTGVPGQTTTLSFANSPLAVEVGSMVNGQPVSLPHVTYTGSATISFAVQMSGEVHTYWGEPVPDVEVRILNDHMTMMEMTDDDGNYFAPDVPMGEMVTVMPSKNNNPANGLSTYALFIGQRFILGMDPPQISSPYQVIAGDANCDGAFTTLDLFVIQQLIIGVRDSFAHCPAWVFVSDRFDMPESDFTAYNVFPYQNCDSIMVVSDTLADFTGVKVGDILGHADPQQLTDIEIRSSQELELVAQNLQAQPGQTLSIPVRSSNFNDITNYQLGLWFDTEHLTFDGFDAPNALPLGSVAAGTTQAANGRISISWFNLQGTGVDADEDAVLFTLRFTANTAIQNLADVMEVRSNWIQSEAYNSAEERMGIVLRFEESGVTAAGEPLADAGYELHQNAPNPFIGNTVIAFDLPENMDAELIVTDQLGRTLRIVRGAYVKGRNTVEFEAGNLAAGAYRYTLRTAGFTATRTMIVVK
jgi:hypothetical protein